MNEHYTYFKDSDGVQKRTCNECRITEGNTGGTEWFVVFTKERVDWFCDQLKQGKEPDCKLCNDGADH